MRRRAREGFHDAAALSEGAALQQLWQHAKQELEVVRRQSVVYSLYARKHKSVMVSGSCSRQYNALEARMGR